MKKLLLAGVAVTALYAGSANAADLARPAPVYVPRPVVVPLFTWTGCYAGGNGGGLWAADTWTDTVFGGFGSNTASGGLGGLQGGCNYQVGAWVFGIQGDYDWTRASSNTANAIIPAFFGGAPVVGLTDSTKHNTLASATGRVGYSWDRFLAYVKGGEYDYYGFSSASPAGLVCPATGGCGFVTNTIGIKTNVNVVKAGINFKFGPGGFN